MSFLIMDVNNLVWCLQNGSDFAKNKLMDLLNNVKSVIDAEMVRPDTDSHLLNREENDNYINGNQKEVVNPDMDSSKQNGSERDGLDYGAIDVVSLKFMNNLIATKFTKNNCRLY